MLTPAVEKFLDKIIQILKDDTIKKKIQILILQPFIQYLIELIFPYFIIMGVIFGILILMITSILYLLLVSKQSVPAVL
jgi:hypothetical protein